MVTEARLCGYDYQAQAAKLYELGGNTNPVVFKDKVLMAIDGSTTCTGVAFVREADGAYCGSIAFKRDKVNGESPVEYKVALKRALLAILRQNRAISNVLYEEPFIEFATAAKNLLMLRTMIEELIAENKPELDYLTYTEVANGKWKKAFLAPEKVPSGTDNQKKAVRKRMVTALPMLEHITQDECDAYAMGYISAVKIAHGDGEELKSKKKVAPFQYEIEFYAADEDAEALAEISESCGAPAVVRANGIGIQYVDGYKKLDDLVYQSIGDTDTLQIIRMPTKKCGNIALKYRLSGLVQSAEYLYIVVWRKARKFR